MRRLVGIVLPLLVFLAALAAGAWFSIQQRAATFKAGIEQRLAATAAPAVLPVTESTSRFSSQEEMLTSIMSALMEGEPLRRAHRLHALLGHLDSTELALLFEHAVTIDDPNRRGALLGGLLKRWGALDPAGATAAARPYRERFKLAGRFSWENINSAVNTAWAEALPELALTDAMANPDLRWAQLTASSAIEALADGDPDKQLKILAGLPPSVLRGRMCSQALTALAEKDPLAAEARLSLLTDPTQRAAMTLDILGKFTEHDPAAGLARLAALAPGLTSDRAGKDLVTAMLRPAAKHDPQAALAALDSLPDELQKSALGAVLMGWADKNPVAALEWTAANGVDPSAVNASISGRGWQSLLAAAFDRDYGKTADWLQRQPSSLQRDTLLGEGLMRGTIEQKITLFSEVTPTGQSAAAATIMQSIGREQMKQAEAWLRSLPPGAARVAAVKTLAAKQADNSPDHIETLVDSWTNEADRNAALSGIAAIRSSSEPLRALEFARRVSDPNAREGAFESIASNWLYRDETAARAWIGNTRDLSAEQKRVLLRRFEER